MSPVRPPVHRRLRLAAVLAHSVPGVSLRLTSVDGDQLLVSSACLGAQLDPCRLRNVLVAPSTGERFAARISEIEIAAGAVHLGGDLYERAHPGCWGERWFVTMLEHAGVACLAGEASFGIPDDAIVVRLKPDAELGACAVCVECVDRTHLDRLDEVATWLLARCMVGELLAELESQRQRFP